MASGYARVRNDSDSDGDPQLSQTEPVAHQEKLHPPPQDGISSASIVRGRSPVLETGMAYPAMPVQGTPELGGVSYPAPMNHPAEFSADNSYPIHSGQQQQSSNTNVTVTQQPSNLPCVVNPQPIPSSNPLLLIVTIMAALFLTLFGIVSTWFCIYPAIIFAILGYSLGDSPKEDQRVIARILNAFTVGCNVAALVTFIVTMGIFITLIVVFIHQEHRYYYD